MKARALGTRDAPLVRTLLAADPVANVFVSSRVDVGLLWPGSPATLYGWPSDRPRHLLHAGANLAPVFAPCPERERDAALTAFADAIGPHRWCQAIVGESGVTLALHRQLCRRGRSYAAQREVRPRQPLMMTRRVPAEVGEAPVRGITMDEFDSYFAAAVAMYSEEVGVDPLAGGGRAGYRSHCQTLVQTGRAWGIVTDGQVVFKADVGISCGGVAQVQGVWLAPGLRGRGLSVPAMAAVTNAVVGTGRTASLYVNDFNAPAVACYRRVGFDEVGALASVLY